MTPTVRRPVPPLARPAGRPVVQHRPQQHLHDPGIGEMHALGLSMKLVDLLNQPVQSLEQFAFHGLPPEKELQEDKRGGGLFLCQPPIHKCKRLRRERVSERCAKVSEDAGMLDAPCVST